MRKTSQRKLCRLKLESLEPRLVLDSTVVFNEIMYHPTDSNPDLEWIELYNQMSIDMDISGWSLAGGVDFQFEEGTILGGGEYLVVALDTAVLQTVTGFAGALGPFVGRLSDGGEKIRLMNNDARVMDVLDYRDEGDWPVGPDGSGATLTKLDPISASDDASNWRTSFQVGGTPGERNFNSGESLLEPVIETGDTATYFVPTDNSLSSNWTELAFDDSVWQQGPTGIGYDINEASYKDIILSDSPVGYWRFEESAGTTAADSSGNNRDGTFTGGVSLENDGIDGGSAALLDGTNDFIDLPGSWGGGAELTIEAWVNTANPITGDFQSIVSGHDPNTFAHFQLNNLGQSGPYTDAGFIGITPISTTPTGQWRHVVLTAKSGSINLYENGVLISSSGASFNTITASSNVDIGIGHVGTRWFRGLMDEVAIYDTALSADKIATHYSVGSSNLPQPPPPAVLAAHWTFDVDGTDETGNHNGTLGGGAAITSESIKGDGALDLRDVSGFVDVTTVVLNGESDMSIAYWVSADTLAGDSSIFANDVSSTGALQANVSSAGLSSLAIQGNSGNAPTIDTIPADGTWVHVAYTYQADSGKIKSYINGNPQPTTTLTTSELAGIGPSTIGAWDLSGAGGYGQFLDGRIDDLRVYTGILTQIEINTLAIPDSTGSATLVAHWTFDTDGADETGTHNGTLTGGATIDTADAAVGAGALDLRTASGAASGYVNIPSTVLNQETSASFAYWLSADSLTAGCCAGIFTNNGWSAGKVHVNFNTATQDVAMAVNSLSPWGSTGIFPTDGSWVHVAFTYDSATGTTTPYLDGVQKTPVVGNIGRTIGDGPSHIGSWDLSRYLNGRIDDMRIYTGVLSPSEVTALATASAPPAAPVAQGAAGLPIGLFGVINTDIETEMLNVNSSAYIRIPFNIDNAAIIDQLNLKMKYDDGFVAYLNGVEVARRNAPGTAGTPLDYNATASVERDNSDAIIFEFIDLSSSIGVLQNGNNVLAIQGLNLTADDDDFLILPELLIHETVGELPLVSINEVAGALEGEFSIEITNFSQNPISLDGFSLALSTDMANPFSLPNQPLAADGYLTFTQNDLGFTPVDGDKIFLFSQSVGIDSVIDAIEVKNNRRARSPDGTGRWLRPDSATPNAANSFNFHDEIVINEILYHNAPTLGSAGTPGTTQLTTLVSFSDAWRFNQSGTDLGAGWAATTHAVDNLQWFPGSGLFGFEPDGTPLPILTAFPDPQTVNPFVTTYYFETEFNFSSGGSSLDDFSLILNTLIDDGAVFYLNGVELSQRLNMNAGTVTASTTATTSLEVSQNQLTFDASLLQEGQNTLAVEVHQGAITSSDVLFGLEIQVSEQLTPTIPGDPYVESEEEWIEIYNRSTTETIDLTGWDLDGAVNFDFPLNTTIAPGEYLVIARDAVDLQTKYPALTNIIGSYSGKLANGNELLVLRDAVNNPADEVHYYDSGRWASFADGGGSSLELRDPNSDNSKAESWAASDEGSKSSWNTYTYRGPAIADIGPTNFNEFILGMLDSGEVLLDDISVVQDPDGAATELIQNGTFEADTILGTADKWRIIGNHGSSSVIVDPTDAANQVLHLVSTGQTEHLSNHAESTLHNGTSFVTIQNGAEYEISFRAKWLGGSRQLHSNLYFNRLAKTTILDAPLLHGTPGVQNSTFETNIGPTYDQFQQSVVVPDAGQEVVISVVAEDPDGMGSMIIKYSVDGGGFQNALMFDQGGGVYTGTIPGQSASSIVQFYVQGVDGSGAVSTYPAEGENSRALYKVQDDQAQLGTLNNFRIIMTTADTDFMHTNTNLMSNDLLGATVVYNETQVFYDVGVRLKGSTYGRPFDQFVSYIVKFQPDQLFRGVHDSVAIDRSARGPVGSPNVDEILIKQLFNHAGGVASNYDDIIRVIAPRSQHTSVAQLNLADYGDVFLDSQFDDGGDFPVFEFDGAYYLTQTTDGNPESPKVVGPGPISYTDIRNLGDDKELYRNNWIIKDNRDEDNFDNIIELNKTFSLSGNALDAVIDDIIDVEQWARHYAGLSLTGVSDTYTHGNPHNLRVYQRPEDGKIISLPHDMDTSFQRSTSSALLGGSNWNLVKIFQRPQNLRLFYGNLNDLISTTYNTTYMSQWTDHFGQLAGSNFSGILSYIGSRASFVQGQLATVAPQIPFEITTNAGADFSVDEVVATIAGDGWIDIDEIRLAGNNEPLEVTWTDQDSWQILLPVNFGPNNLILEAYDRSGNIVGSDTINITSTTSNRPIQDFLRITELNYNPEGSDAPEFIELKNVSSGINAVTLDLTGVQITQGPSSPFGFTGSNVTSLEPGEFVLVVKDLSEFSTLTSTYPDVSTSIIAGQFAGSLSNGGELIEVRDADGAIVQQFTYVDGDDPGEEAWHSETDNKGFTLVPISTDGDYNDPANWRSSAEKTGSPGADDPLALSADFDGNGNVDAADLAILLANYGTAIGADRSTGDANHDHKVSLQDLLLLKKQFGDTISAPPNNGAAAAEALVVNIGSPTANSEPEIETRTSQHARVVDQILSIENTRTSQNRSIRGNHQLHRARISRPHVDQVIGQEELQFLKERSPLNRIQARRLRKSKIIATTDHSEML